MARTGTALGAKPVGHFMGAVNLHIPKIAKLRPGQEPAVLPESAMKYTLSPPDLSRQTYLPVLPRKLLVMTVRFW
jgi:hypothetical protein